MSDSWKHVQPLLKFINANISYVYFLFYLTLGYLVISAIDPANLDTAANVLQALADGALPEPIQTGFMTALIFLIGIYFVYRAFSILFDAASAFNSIRYYARRFFGWSSQEIDIMKRCDSIFDQFNDLYWLLPSRKDPSLVDDAILDIRADLDDLLTDYQLYTAGGSNNA